MSLYTRFAAGLVFPLHERIKGHDSVAVRERLERSQWRTRAEIEAEQIEHILLVEVSDVIDRLADNRFEQQIGGSL